MIKILNLVKNEKNDWKKQVRNFYAIYVYNLTTFEPSVISCHLILANKSRRRTDSHERGTVDCSNTELPVCMIYRRPIGIYYSRNYIDGTTDFEHTA